MESEKQPLIPEEKNIQTKDGSKKTEEKSVFTYRKLVIFPHIFLFMFGMGIFTYVFNEWLQNKIKTDSFFNVTIHKNYSSCEEQNKTDPDYVIYKHVQQKTSQWLIYFKLALYCPCIITNLFIPSYSDIYGRRGLMLGIALVVSLRICAQSVVIYFNQEIFYLIIPYICEGFVGATSSLFAIYMAYIADITSDSQRIFGIVAIEFTLLFASMISAPLSGLLIETWGLGYKITSLICSGSMILSFLLLLFFLPETLKKSDRKPFKSPLSAVRETFSFYYSDEFRGKRLYYLVIFLAFMFTELSSGNRSAMETIYFLGQPFCWGPSLIGYFSLARHGAQGFIGLTLIKPLQKCLSNTSITILSLTSNIGSYVLEAFATTNIEMFCVPIAGALSFIAIPMLRGLISLLTSTEKQGAVFASLSVVVTAGGLMTSSENEIYAATLSIMNGFVFLSMAFFSFIALMLILLFSCSKPNIQSKSSKIVIEKK